MSSRVLACGQANQCATADLFSDDDVGQEGGPKNAALEISGVAHLYHTARQIGVPVQKCRNVARRT